MPIIYTVENPCAKIQPDSPEPQPAVHGPSAALKNKAKLKKELTSTVTAFVSPSPFYKESQSQPLGAVAHPPLISLACLFHLHPWCTLQGPCPTCLSFFHLKSRPFSPGGLPAVWDRQGLRSCTDSSSPELQVFLCKLTLSS